MGTKKNSHIEGSAIGSDILPASDICGQFLSVAPF